MTSEYRGPQLAREDDELTRELRAIYAPPPHPSYWITLEQRIMARVHAGATAGRWWSVPDSWLRAGLLAAGLAVVVAGSLLIRSQARSSRLAYDTIANPVAADVFEIARRVQLSEEEETLRRLTGR